jgi:hypothetical protein
MILLMYTIWLTAIAVVALICKLTMKGRDFPPFGYQSLCIPPLAA